MSESRFVRPQDFEFSGSNGQCKICPGKNKFMRLNHLRVHEASITHREAVSQLQRSKAVSRETDATVSTQHAPGGGHSSGRDGQEDSDAMIVEDSWLAGLQWDISDSYAKSGHPAEASHPGEELPSDMRDAIAGRVAFSAGEEFTDRKAAQSSLAEALRGTDIFERFVPSQDQESLLDNGNRGPEPEDALRSEVPLTAQEVSESLFGTGDMSGRVDEYFPYPSKAMMKTDVLFSSPRLRFSREQQEAILAWGNDLGAKEVPTMYAVERFQKAALDAVGDPMVRVQADSGNVLYINSLLRAMARDYAHPATRKQIRAFPESPASGPVSEVWQSSKWLEDAPDEILTPMIRIEGKDFYIKELVHCRDKRWFIPMQFVRREGEMWAVGHRVSRMTDGLHVMPERSVEKCSNFWNNWPEIAAHNGDRGLFADSSSDWACQMPNPDRELANGLEWECPPIIVFIDDVSGNSTKQWNVHYSAYMSNAGLPRSELEKERNIRFVATSPHASPMEIMQAVCNDLKTAGGATPFKAWDSVRRRHILIRPWLLFLPGDNPMQAELCSHIGLNANVFCRCCMVGGTKAFKESDEGYRTLMKPGIPRNAAETRQTVLDQLESATHAAATKPLQDAMSKTGVKDSLAMPTITRLLTIGKALRRSTPTRHAVSITETEKFLRDELLKLKDAQMVNPLLDMPGLDVHKDTPVEALHTVILGILKYFWGQTTWVIEKNGHWAVFQARLNSLDSSGLDIPNIMADYICRYRGSLIGKHLKTLSQVISFAIIGLVDQQLQDTWRVLGRLVVLIWETEIADLNSYTDELRDIIQTVQDFAAALSPSLLTLKDKFHILSHLPDHILRFGPALLFSTERYESFNRIFRLCSIHSNRQAPSRDIAMAFANQDRCRHIMTGGFWYDTKQEKWVSASPAVLKHLQTCRRDAHLLGVYTDKAPSPGTITLPPTKSSHSADHAALGIPWAETMASHLLERPGLWRAAKTLITVSGDVACDGSEVLVHCNGEVPSPTGLTLRFATILQLLAPCEAGHRTAVVIRWSNLKSELHPVLKLPVLHRSGPVDVLDVMDIICVVNVQHDCSTYNCIADGHEAMRQERETTSRTRAVVHHRETSTYVVNLHAIHNRDYLKCAIPRAFQVVQSPFRDRDQLYRAAARSLRDQKLQKKLAREAAARKQAENALRTVGERGGRCTVLLGDGGKDVPVDALGLVQPEGDGVDRDEWPAAEVSQTRTQMQQDTDTLDAEVFSAHRPGTSGTLMDTIPQATVSISGPSRGHPIDTFGGLIPRGPRQRRTRNIGTFPLSDYPTTDEQSEGTDINRHATKVSSLDALAIEATHAPRLQGSKRGRGDRDEDQLIEYEHQRVVPRPK